MDSAPRMEVSAIWNENTGRYHLRKRSRAVAHRIWVEEEPMDSADPVSYREAIAHPRFGQK